MKQPSWVTDEIDLSMPAAARVYDHYLGGLHTFEADRDPADTREPERYPVWGGLGRRS